MHNIFFIIFSKRVRKFCLYCCIIMPCKYTRASTQVHLICPQFSLFTSDGDQYHSFLNWKEQANKKELYKSMGQNDLIWKFLHALLIMKFSQVPSFLSTFQTGHLTIKNHVSCARCLHGFFFFVDDDDSFCNIMKNTKRN